MTTASLAAHPVDGFVHLHVHTEFSLLDGAIRIPKLAEKAAELGMKAVAVTDHGSMFGALQLYHKCKANGVEPIFGCEINLVLDDALNGHSKLSHHLVLLAESQEGYQNLIRLVSLGWVEGLHQGRPHVSMETLQKYTKGVIGLSGCMGGLVSQDVLTKGEKVGKQTLQKLAACFAPECFFVELQNHGFIEQEPLNEILVELASELKIPVVATNDCHYLEKEDAQPQMALQCIGAGCTLEDMKGMHHKSEEMYFKSGEEMQALFQKYPDAISNTAKIAERCAGKVALLKDPQLPNFQTPSGTTEEEHLRALCKEGLLRRFEELQELALTFDEVEYKSRLDHELEVILSMGFAGYFLIVQDFINWTKEKGIPVGPGRGSGAGSIAAWALRITDLDPIPYGLLFERFLNPERVSMPDFDIDFCMSRRDEVIEYVREKYGADSVGQIATFHQLKSRSVVRDVARVMGMTPAEGGSIATLVPEPIQGRSVPIEDAIKQEPRLKALYKEDKKVTELLDTSMKLENLTRHAGMHAAGVVLSEGPLWDHVPVFCPEQDVYVTQFHKDDVEAAGLVKFDFLGLKTLTVIDVAVDLINRRPDREETPFEISKISMQDKATFKLLQTGETTNVFQLESSGMQTLFKQLKPDCFEDIVAAVALYRPGPLGSGMVEDFVQRKHGRVQVSYPHPSLESALKETYGVIVYQEQVMQIARQMAGYTLGGADLLRRAMGKKKPEEMAKQKAIFLEGAKEKGFDDKDAAKVFELMEYFAGYGFNKSHSAAYALITYQTAYLKAHFPVEFMCATLTADKEKSDKVVRTVAEAKSMGVTVLPPDVNESEIDFTVVYNAEANASIKRKKNTPVCTKGTVQDAYEPKIRFGLGAIKGVGQAALEALFEAREKSVEEGLSEDGAQKDQTAIAQVRGFSDLFDFCGRVDLRRINKSVCESLIQCGAFDSMHKEAGIHRAQAFVSMETAFEQGKKLAAERASGQTNLFGLMGGSSESATQTNGQANEARFLDVDPWDFREMLGREKATLGFYVSGHPLDRYRSELKRFCTANSESLVGVQDGHTVTIGGSVEDFRERTTKTGRKIAFFNLEDPFGRTEIIVRHHAIEKPGVRELLASNEPVLVTGKVQKEQSRDGGDASLEAKIVLLEAKLLIETFTEQAKSVHITLDVEEVDEPKLKQIKDTLALFPGQCPVFLHLHRNREWEVRLRGPNFTANPTEALLSKLELSFGEKICEFR